MKKTGLFFKQMRKNMETELILIGTMASFILGLQFYGIKQIGKLCERVTRLETMLNGLRD